MVALPDRRAGVRRRGRVLIPVLSGLAAVGLTALMVGATATNLLIGYNP